METRRPSCAESGQWPAPPVQGIGPPRQKYPACPPCPWLRQFPPSRSRWPSRRTCKRDAFCAVSGMTDRPDARVDRPAQRLSGRSSCSAVSSVGQPGCSVGTPPRSNTQNGSRTSPSARSRSSSNVNALAETTKQLHVSRSNRRTEAVPDRGCQALSRVVERTSRYTSKLARGTEARDHDALPCKFNVTRAVSFLAGSGARSETEPGAAGRHSASCAASPARSLPRSIIVIQLRHAAQRLKGSASWYNGKTAKKR